MYIKYTLLLASLVLNEVLCAGANPSSFRVRGFKRFVKRLVVVLHVRSLV